MVLSNVICPNDNQALINKNNMSTVCRIVEN